nr:TIR domain-containing protein [Hyphomonadaceae bacterium]
SSAQNFPRSRIAFGVRDDTAIISATTHHGLRAGGSTNTDTPAPHSIFLDRLGWRGYCGFLIGRGVSDLPHIFLSYNREDRSAAMRFAGALEALGHSVWWDAGLRVGEAYDEVTEAALRGASAVVVLWSPRSVVSRWVRAEATIAQKLGTLFPVMIEPCERPVMFELTQTADLCGWNGAARHPAWAAFCTELQAFVAARPVQDEASPAAPVRLPGPPANGPGARIGRRRVLLQAAAVVTLAGAGATGIVLVRRSGRQAPARSLAVLPFANISGSPDQDYFSEGLSAELRAALTRNPALQVAAPTSSREVARANDDLRGMARQLGVAFVLQGSVAKAGDTIRVAADLIDARAGLTKWSETFERSLADVFAVQSEIAGMVATALAARIGGPDPSGGETTSPAPAGAPSTPGGSANVAAFEDFLHGREALGRAASIDTDRQALAWFDAAIAKDPGYAAAHAWRARTLSVLASQAGDGAAMRSNRDAAIGAARTAISLAPGYPAGYATLGWVLFNQVLDVKAARDAFDRARTLAPGDADVLMASAVFNARTGRPTAAREDITRALVLDPLNPYAFRVAGTVSMIAGDNARALEELDRALALNPAASVIQAFRAQALAGLDRWPEAREAWAAEPSDMFKQQGLAIADWKLGNREAARAAFNALQATSGDSANYQKAQVLAQWGEPDAALDALEAAHGAGDAGLAQLYTDPFLVTLRNTPRFRALLSSIGFV